MSAMTPRLRAVTKPKPPLLTVDLARAWRLFPESSELAAKWLAAVHWMQARPGGSIWLLDRNRPASKWRALPTEEQ